MNYSYRTAIYNKIIVLIIVCLLAITSVASSKSHSRTPYVPYFQAKQSQQTRYHHRGSDDNVWGEITKSFSLPHYPQTPAVKQQIAWFMSHKSYFEKMAAQAEPYLYYIHHEVKKHNMPGELALLPMIESAYNPFAYSSAGAAGLWQLMPGTATGLGLHRDYWYDGRKDIIKSTHAALEYLTYLKGFFHSNWLLAIASYDSGQGTVLRAVKYNRSRGYPTKFWSLRLPRETQAYVPRLLAVAEIISHPKKYPIKLPKIKNEPYFDTVKVKGKISLASVAKKANIKLNDLYQLNPGYRRWTTDPDKHGPHRIILPIKNIPIYKHTTHISPLVAIKSSQHYTVQKGDNLGKIAKKSHIDLKTLKSLNHLNSNKIKIGQTLIVSKVMPQKPASTKTTTVSANPPAKAVSMTHYNVKSGDSLWTIAKHHSVSIAQLRTWNHLSKSSKLKIGQTLLIKPKHVAQHTVHTTKKRNVRIHIRKSAHHKTTRHEKS